MGKELFQGIHIAFIPAGERQLGLAEAQRTAAFAVIDTRNVVAVEYVALVDAHKIGR